MSSDIDGWLQAVIEGDHKRGCAGREYSCSCGFDAKRDEVLIQAAQTIREFRKQCEGMRDIISRARMVGSTLPGSWHNDAIHVLDAYRTFIGEKG